MSFVDYGYLLSLLGVGIFGLLVIFAIDLFGKRKKPAQRLGMSEKEKENHKE